MSPADLDAMRTILRPVDLRQQTVLFDVGDKISAVYFPWNAVVSMVVGLSTGEMVEAAMVGRDGVVGALAALDGKTSLTRAIVQIGGRVAMCDVDSFKRIALHDDSVAHSQSRTDRLCASAAIRRLQHLARCRIAARPLVAACA